MQGQAAYKDSKSSYQDLLQGAEKNLKKVEKNLRDTLGVSSIFCLSVIKG